MNGQELKKRIDDSGVHYDVVAAAVGKNKRTIYRLFDLDEIELHILKKIQAAGVDLSLSVTEEKTNHASPQAMMQIMEAMMGYMDMIKKDHELYRTIIEQGVKDGTLRFQAIKEKM